MAINPRGAAVKSKRILTAALFFILLVCGAGEVFAADQPPDAVVLYDQKFGSSLTSTGFRKQVRDFLTAFGFETMDTGGLVEWMNSLVASGAKGTLLVMNTDKMPSWIAGDKPGSPSLFRKYLEAGGTVLWYGDYPGKEISYQLEKNQMWGAEGSIGLIGMDATGVSRGGGAVQPTGKGAALGLRKGGISMMPVPEGSVTDVLAKAGDGYTSAWTRSFVPGSPGFVRIWDYRLDSLDKDRAVELFNIVTNLLPRFAGRKSAASVYFHKPSDYYPLTHIEDDRLVREMRVAYFNESAPSDAKYELDISRGGKVIETIPLEDCAAPYFVRAFRINLFAPDQTVTLIEKTGSKRKEITSGKMSDSSFFAESRITALPAINPVDLGYVLVPGDVVLASPGQKISADLKMAFPGAAAKNDVEARLRISDAGKIVAESSAEFSVQGEIVEGNIAIDTSALAAGSYTISLSLSKLKIIYIIEKKLVLAEKKPARKFGAYYASIDFPGSVGIYDYPTKQWSKISWDRAWERGPDYDVVVPFADGNRFIFWRGSGYVPFWVSAQNSGMTYEWLEASQRRGVLFDAVEPLQDKECRYSRAYVISSTPARVVVGWRYALVGLGYGINADEWADETYTFYPDGYGVRKAVGYLEPLSWHEGSEFIVLLPPGYNPFDVYPPEIFRILSPDGKQKESIISPPGSSAWKTGGPAVFRVNYNKYDKNTPVLAVRKFDGFGSIYDGWKVDGRYISPNYWGVHFPVQRGYPTTRQEPPGWRERAGHASIATVTVEPFESRTRHGKLERKTWGWFIGNSAAPDEDVLSAARSWISPVKAEVLSGGSGGSYDVYQRGYSITAELEAREVEVRLKGEADEKIFNPVFMIEGFSGTKAKVSIDGAEPKIYEAAAEESFDKARIVVWIGEPVRGNAVVKITSIDR